MFWDHLGSRPEFSDLLFEVTGFGLGILGRSDGLKGISTVRKMSWASRRVTTRVEDRAYSLLGIFDVNMPFLYGEGEKAFIRLQEDKGIQMSFFVITCTYHQYTAPGPVIHHRGWLAILNSRVGKICLNVQPYF